MSAEALIEEGRRLQRKRVFLKSEGVGEVAGMWHHPFPRIPSDVGFEPWLTVDTRFIPGFDSSKARFLTVLTSNEDDTGKVEAVAELPAGVPLYAHEVELLPPIDAVFLLGSSRVAEWLKANNWDRRDRYNRNFGDWAVVEAYDREWACSDPVFGRDANLYAALGGWPFANADEDWFDLLNERLLVVTVEDSEPWVEAWEAPSGVRHVVQRIT